MAWARRNEIDYPPELETQVLLHGHRIVDWQSCYENLKKLYSEKEREVTALTDCRGDLLHQIKAVEEQLQQAGSKQLATRERDSVMKLIIGMAVRGYRYDPTAVRNSATGEICSDLAELGLSLDSDTVRKWLREAAELLPRQDSGAGQKQMP